MPDGGVLPTPDRSHERCRQDEAFSPPVRTMSARRSASTWRRVELLFSAVRPSRSLLEFARYTVLSVGVSPRREIGCCMESLNERLDEAAQVTGSARCRSPCTWTSAQSHCHFPGFSRSISSERLSEGRLVDLYRPRLGSEAPPPPPPANSRPRVRCRLGLRAVRSHIRISPPAPCGRSSRADPCED